MNQFLRFIWLGGYSFQCFMLGAYTYAALRTERIVEAHLFVSAILIAWLQLGLFFQTYKEPK